MKKIIYVCVLLLNIVVPSRAHAALPLTWLMQQTIVKYGLNYYFQRKSLSSSNNTNPDSQKSWLTQLTNITHRFKRTRKVNLWIYLLSASLSALAGVIDHHFALEGNEIGTKLHQYNPAFKKYTQATLNRIFTRLQMIRKIKADIELKTGIKTTYHIMENNSFNAFAVAMNGSAHVGFTEGWLITDKLTHDQFERYLKAVMLHELGHAALAHSTKGVAARTARVMLANFVLWIAEPTNEKEYENRLLALTALEFCLCGIDYFADKSLSRQFEYQADAFAAQFVPGEDLKQALEFITPTAMKQPLTQELSYILNWRHSHPPTQRRGKRLTTPGATQKSVWSDPECYKWWLESEEKPQIRDETPLIPAQ